MNRDNYSEIKKNDTRYTFLMTLLVLNKLELLFMSSNFRLRLSPSVPAPHYELTGHGYEEKFVIISMS